MGLKQSRWSKEKMDISWSLELVYIFRNGKVEFDNDSYLWINKSNTFSTGWKMHTFKGFMDLEIVKGLCTHQEY